MNTFLLYYIFSNKISGRREEIKLLVDFKCTHRILMNPDADLRMSEIDFGKDFFLLFKYLLRSFQFYKFTNYDKITFKTVRFCGIDYNH